jgi:hypothetical protein
MHKKIFFYIPILILASLGFIFIASKVETYTYPVVTNLNITSLEPLNYGWSKIYIRVTKRRDCPLVGLNMYYRANSNVMIPIQYLLSEDPIIHRNDGVHEFGPVYVQIPSEHIDHLLMVTRHSCHILFDSISFISPTHSN